jgi:recombination protein RecT
MKRKENLPAKQDPSLAERFTNMVVKEYSATVSNVKLTELQRKLAQHLFVRADMALTELEKRRMSKGGKGTPITWANVNMQKMAVDAVHRIELGLDALVPNHLHTIPYFNGKSKKYDLDLRVGYVGKDYYYRKLSLHPIVDISYELVHDNDEFTVIKKGLNQKVESYEFKIDSPFDRGPVVGGFGYISYENPAMNQLVILTLEDFKKSRGAAMSNDFWGKHTEAMQYKTIVHRTVSKIVLDPTKINESFARVEADDRIPEDEKALFYATDEISDQANKGQVIDINPVVVEGPGDEQTEISPEEVDEIEAEERAMMENEAGSSEGPDF